jgi:enoyl-CoA hydratase
MTDTLVKEIRGNVMVLTINRPEARNAMDFETATAIAAALDELDARDDLSIAVLTGAGNTFCSGMDLKGFLAGKRPSIPGRGFGGVTERPPRKVLIAAVEGYALAGGFELVLACDLVVASREAKFGLPEVKRGLAAAAGGLMRLPRRVPYHVAMEYSLTGDMLPATRAYELGLVNRLTEAGGAGCRAAAGRCGRRQRAAGHRREQAGGGAIGRLDPRRNVRASTAADRVGFHLGRRARRRGGICGEAQAGMDRQVTPCLDWPPRA